ncbi:hypothetical protein DSECCO2_457530 [anaerobic digester metagenome]
MVEVSLRDDVDVVDDLLDRPRETAGHEEDDRTAEDDGKSRSGSALDEHPVELTLHEPRVVRQLDDDAWIGRIIRVFEIDEEVPDPLLVLCILHLLIGSAGDDRPGDELPCPGIGRAVRHPDGVAEDIVYADRIEIRVHGNELLRALLRAQTVPLLHERIRREPEFEKVAVIRRGHIRILPDLPGCGLVHHAVGGELVSKTHPGELVIKTRDVPEIEASIGRIGGVLDNPR